MRVEGRQCGEAGIGQEPSGKGRAGLFYSSFSRTVRRLLGWYYALYGSLALAALLMYVILQDRSVLSGDSPSGALWLPLSGWLAFGVGSLCVGIGLIRLWPWARWLGVPLAALFLVDGVLRLDLRTDDLLSLLMFFAVPILTLAILLAPQVSRPSETPAADGQTPCSMIRQEFIGLLHLLGSAEKQRDYQREVEWVHTPIEMISMFCDDLYRPDWPHWISCFTSAELEELGILNEAVEAADEHVSHEIELDELLTTAPWQGMMREARRVAELLAARA